MVREKKKRRVIMPKSIMTKRTGTLAAKAAQVHSQRWSTSHLMVQVWPLETRGWQWTGPSQPRAAGAQKFWKLPKADFFRLPAWHEHFTWQLDTGPATGRLTADSPCGDSTQSRKHMQIKKKNKNNTVCLAKLCKSWWSKHRLDREWKPGSNTQVCQASPVWLHAEGRPAYNVAEF